MQYSLAKAISLALLVTGSAYAAEHPLSKLHYDEASGINTVDMVMSIDWDINNPPENRGKDFVEKIIKQSSQSLFTMTEGKVRMGKVSVYGNKQFMDNTDIQYLLKDGRANAAICGFNSSQSATIQMFAGTNESEDAHGKTVAHEIGHYLLGLFDEYREEGKVSQDPTDPQDKDTPRNTIMNNHLQFEALSTPTDYADETQRETAHFRAYKQSAWETLLTPPGNEPQGYAKRAELKALQAMKIAPTALIQPKTGWEEALQVVYMGGNSAPAPTSKPDVASPQPDQGTGDNTVTPVQGQDGTQPRQPAHHSPRTRNHQNDFGGHHREPGTTERANQCRAASDSIRWQ